MGAALADASESERAAASACAAPLCILPPPPAVVRATRTEGDNPQGKTFWKKSFEVLKDRAFVPAILQKLILDREPDRVLAFAGVTCL